MTLGKIIKNGFNSVTILVKHKQKNMDVIMEELVNGFNPDPPYDPAKLAARQIDRCDGPFDCGNQPLLYFAACVGEEAGEILGAVRKLQKPFNSRDRSKFIKKHDPDGTRGIKEFATSHIKRMWEAEKRVELAKELADAYLQINLLAQKAGINLHYAVQVKFNEVNRELQLDESWDI